jgi:hypothetical protein
VCGITGERLVGLQKRYVAYARRLRILAQESKKVAEADRVVVEAEEEEEGGTCAVCLSLAAFGQKWQIPVCGHVFHSDCLSQCAQTDVDGRQLGLKCPKCRTDVTVPLAADELEFD